MQRRRRKVYSEGNFEKLKCAEGAFFVGLKLENSRLCRIYPTYEKSIDMIFENSIMDKIRVIHKI